MDQQIIILTAIIATFSISLSGTIAYLGYLRRQRVQHTALHPDFSALIAQSRLADARVTQTNKTVNIDDLDLSESFVITVHPDDEPLPKYTSQRAIG